MTTGALAALERLGSDRKRKVCAPNAVDPVRLEAAGHRKAQSLTACMLFRARPQFYFLHALTRPCPARKDMATREQKDETNTSLIASVRLPRARGRNPALCDGTNGD